MWGGEGNLRVTLNMTDAIEKKVRIYQADTIKKTGKNYSFSRAVDDLVLRGLK